MKAKLVELMNKKSIFNVMALFVFMLSTQGANTRSTFIFHELEKPEALKKLRKF